MKEENSLSSGQSAAPLPLASANLMPSRSPAMRELQCAITDIARADLPVLLIGEKGTGKEAIARQIHTHHGGADAPFVTIQCSEQTPPFFRELLAKTTRPEGETPGQLTTLFLDEVCDLTPACQDAVVEAIADGDGKAQPHRVGTHLISATSRSLEEEIGKARFREDLFYRLNGICLRIPPLRHRKEDIPALLEFFLKLHGETPGNPPAALRAESMQVLLQHSWPGNVRELEEFAKKILISGESTALSGLKASSGTPATEKPSVALSLKEAARNASRQVERELILKTLGRTRWNRKRAAQELGISYKALLYKLKQITLDDPKGI
ncbi:MAG TPA: sigma 54-interacting transcriptional regulator [Patescibacteria group bacterium]|nr:sigma 54-interacting transcriptional regulator [Patescibacteria group bacterium]